MGVSSAPRIAVLASGRGSNFVAIAEAIARGDLHAEIAVVASDRAEALALEKARTLGLPTLVEKNQVQLLKQLLSLNLNCIVLAGYMRLLPPEFVEAFRDPRGFSWIVNVHPSLLPAFPGLHSYEKAFLHGVKVSGVSVHFVDSGLDTGPLCAQQAFVISHCESVAEVEELGLKTEHILFPQTLSWILHNKFDIRERGGRLHVQPH